MLHQDGVDCASGFASRAQHLHQTELGDTLTFSTDQQLAAFLLQYSQACFTALESHESPCPVPGSEDGDSPRTQALLVLVIVLPILLCIVWSSVFCMKRLRRASGRTLFGQVKPPLEGPDSTLVVTDIESSTALWEQLDESVMDKAIALHHSCFRNYIYKHGGYEAQMEGDSFIIAFHDPQSAADFCIAMQGALLLLDWPWQLLELERCQPIYVSKTAVDQPSDHAHAAVGPLPPPHGPGSPPAADAHRHSPEPQHPPPHSEGSGNDDEHHTGSHSRGRGRRGSQRTSAHKAGHSHPPSALAEGGSRHVGAHSAAPALAQHLVPNAPCATPDTATHASNFEFPSQLQTQSHLRHEEAHPLHPVMLSSAEVWLTDRSGSEQHPFLHGSPPSCASYLCSTAASLGYAGRHWAAPSQGSPSNSRGRLYPPPWPSASQHSIGLSELASGDVRAFQSTLLPQESVVSGHGSQGEQGCAGIVSLHAHATPASLAGSAHSGGYASGSGISGSPRNTPLHQCAWEKGGLTGVGPLAPSPAPTHAPTSATTSMPSTATDNPLHTRADGQSKEGSKHTGSASVDTVHDVTLHGFIPDMLARSAAGSRDVSAHAPLLQPWPYPDSSPASPMPLPPRAPLPRPPPAAGAASASAVVDGAMSAAAACRPASTEQPVPAAAGGDANRDAAPDDAPTLPFPPPPAPPSPPAPPPPAPPAKASQHAAYAEAAAPRAHVGTSPARSYSVDPSLATVHAFHPEQLAAHAAAAFAVAPGLAAKVQEERRRGRVPRGSSEQPLLPYSEHEEGSQESLQLEQPSASQRSSLGSKEQMQPAQQPFVGSEPCGGDPSGGCAPDGTGPSHHHQQQKRSSSFSGAKANSDLDGWVADEPGKAPGRGTSEGQTLLETWSGGSKHSSLRGGEGSIGRQPTNVQRRLSRSSKGSVHWADKAHEAQDSGGGGQRRAKGAAMMHGLSSKGDHKGPFLNAEEGQLEVPVNGSGLFSEMRHLDTPQEQQQQQLQQALLFPLKANKAAQAPTTLAADVPSTDDLLTELSLCPQGSIRAVTMGSDRCLQQDTNGLVHEVTLSGTSAEQFQEASQLQPPPQQQQSNFKGRASPTAPGLPGVAEGEEPVRGTLNFPLQTPVLPSLPSSERHTGTHSLPQHYLMHSHEQQQQRQRRQQQWWQPRPQSQPLVVIEMVPNSEGKRGTGGSAQEGEPWLGENWDLGSSAPLKIPHSRQSGASDRPSMQSGALDQSSGSRIKRRSTGENASCPPPNNPSNTHVPVPVGAHSMWGAEGHTDGQAGPAAPNGSLSSTPSTRIARPLRVAASTIMASAPSWAQDAWAQASELARSMLPQPNRESMTVGLDEEQPPRQARRSTNRIMGHPTNRGSKPERSRARNNSAPSVTATPIPATLTVRESLLYKWHRVEAHHPGATLVFRGLRVRMGINSGIYSAADCKFNKAAGRMHYTGRSLGYAKAISDAACGGMVLLGHDTHERLSMPRLLEHIMTLHLGEHMLRKETPVMSLHEIIARPLMGRLPLMAPISSLRQHSMGVLDAPAGVVTVAFMSVVNESAVMNWNLSVASEAFSLFQEHVCALLHKHGGYLVESNDGLVLASFAKPASALRWAVQCMQQMPKIHWPEELESWQASMAAGPVVLDPYTGEALPAANAAKGLRIKVGLDCGKLKGEINCMTGRMAYRGKYMNRASRVASIARPGQVLASADVWHACQPHAPQKRLAGVSLGHFNLKGVLKPLEVYQVTHQGLGRSGSMVMRTREDFPTEEVEGHTHTGMRSRALSHMSGSVHAGLASFARPSRQSSSIAPGQDPAYDAAVAATLLPGHPGPQRSSAHPSFNAASDGIPAGLQEARSLVSPRHLSAAQALSSGMLGERSRATAASHEGHNHALPSGWGSHQLQTKHNKNMASAADQTSCGTMVGMLTSTEGNLTGSFASKRRTGVVSSGPSVLAGSMLSGSTHHSQQLTQRQAAHIHSHLPITLPKTDLEYEQQWHGLPVDELDEMDDASIDFNVRNEDSDANSRHFMSVYNNGTSGSQIGANLERSRTICSSHGSLWGIGQLQLAEHANAHSPQHSSPASPPAVSPFWNSSSQPPPSSSAHPAPTLGGGSKPSNHKQRAFKEEPRHNSRNSHQPSQPQQPKQQRRYPWRGPGRGRSMSFNVASQLSNNSSRVTGIPSAHALYSNPSDGAEAMPRLYHAQVAPTSSSSSSGDDDGGSSSSSSSSSGVGFRVSRGVQHIKRSVTHNMEPDTHAAARTRRGWHKHKATDPPQRSSTNTTNFEHGGKSFSALTRDGHGCSAPQQPLELMPGGTPALPPAPAGLLSRVMQVPTSLKHIVKSAGSGSGQERKFSKDGGAGSSSKGSPRGSVAQAATGHTQELGAHLQPKPPAQPTLPLRQASHNSTSYFVPSLPQASSSSNLPVGYPLSSVSTNASQRQQSCRLSSESNTRSARASLQNSRGSSMEGHAHMLYPPAPPPPPPGHTNPGGMWVWMPQGCGSGPQATGMPPSPWQQQQLALAARPQAAGGVGAPLPAMIGNPPIWHAGLLAHPQHVQPQPQPQPQQQQPQPQPQPQQQAGYAAPGPGVAAPPPRRLPPRRASSRLHVVTTNHHHQQQQQQQQQQLEQPHPCLGSGAASSPQLRHRPREHAPHLQQQQQQQVNEERRAGAASAPVYQQDISAAHSTVAAAGDEATHGSTHAHSSPLHKAQDSPAAASVVTWSSRHARERRVQQSLRAQQRSVPLPQQGNSGNGSHAGGGEHTTVSRSRKNSTFNAPRASHSPVGAHSSIGSSLASALMGAIRRHSGLLAHSTSPPHSPSHLSHAERSHGSLVHGSSVPRIGSQIRASDLHSMDGSSLHGHRQGSIPDDLNLLVVEGEADADNTASSSGYSSDTGGDSEYEASSRAARAARLHSFAHYGTAQQGYQQGHFAQHPLPRDHPAALPAGSPQDSPANIASASLDMFADLTTNQSPQDSRNTSAVFVPVPPPSSPTHPCSPPRLVFTPCPAPAQILTSSSHGASNPSSPQPPPLGRIPGTEPSEFIWPSGMHHVGEQGDLAGLQHRTTPCLACSTSLPHSQPAFVHAAQDNWPIHAQEHPPPQVQATMPHPPPQIQATMPPAQILEGNNSTPADVEAALPP